MFLIKKNVKKMGHYPKDSKNHKNKTYNINKY